MSYKQSNILRNTASLFLLLLTSPILHAQTFDTNATYTNAIKYYKAKDYKSAAIQFSRVIDSCGYEISSTSLYNGACIYALNQDTTNAIKALGVLADKRLYTNYQHIAGDSDLICLHACHEWKSILDKVKHNEETLPQRIKEKAKDELLKAKAILNKDDGRLWGENIWTDKSIILGRNGDIYSLYPLKGSSTTDSVLYYKKIEPNELSQTNTVQEYEGEKFATILYNYLNNNSGTIIHELFHILQAKHIKLYGNQIDYLDSYDAREWLRLEFQALRNALKSANEQKEKSVVESYLHDAITFRKLRQDKYSAFLKEELEIETLEGTANYTGYILSTYPNKYKEAIKEIDEREVADTYTRPFPYATGFAYGLLFDHLNIQWRQGLDHVYNFLDIYEKQCLGKALNFTANELKNARKRNSYDSIHKQEAERKKVNEKNIAYYTEMFFKKPTLSVLLADSLFAQSYDMNGTLSLKEKGMVYSNIKGKDRQGKNFGNFSTAEGKAALGVSGILKKRNGKNTWFTFPLPTEIKGNTIVGEYYTIELNQGWKVEKADKKGNLRIVKAQ
ncbi:hypothetical protein [uncultured Acetobacteroides sp.]|uniref:hypothetical protein n=1 Tax=uncultured Acetobacteroides sp. TaxID=1760811 RepID=UPI0029F592F2|nr:hypothetical protein [uncultured Acetobacteroides sp.]